MSKTSKDLDISPIFQPITINKLEIKNRIAMSPMNCNYTDPEHYISRQQMAYYAARAKGGTGLIITEAQAVSEHPIADTYRKYNNPYLTNYKYIPTQSNFVEHVHSFGARIFAQLFTGPGRQGSDDLGAAGIVAASAIPWESQIEKIINGVTDDVITAGARLAGYHGEIPSLDLGQGRLLLFAGPLCDTGRAGRRCRQGADRSGLCPRARAWLQSRLLANPRNECDGNEAL